MERSELDRKTVLFKDKLLKGLKSKYYLVIVSNLENLDLCINHAIAGFPETKEGQWAFLDINVGDYVSFYYNGKIFGLFMVEDKKIENEYKNRIAISLGNIPEIIKIDDNGKERFVDPIGLRGSNDKWTAITRVKKVNGVKTNIHKFFPFRLYLNPIDNVKNEAYFIYKKGMERLGVNLIPRNNMAKSHIQVPFDNINIFFSKYLVKPSYNNLNLEYFMLCGNRHEIRNTYEKNKKGKTFKVLETIGEIAPKSQSNEHYLQALIKKLLEAYMSEELLTYFGFDSNSTFDVEYFSEQRVEAGNADLIITCDKTKTELIIEVKKVNVFEDNNELIGLTKIDQKFQNYYSIFPDNKTIRAIAGQGPNKTNGIILDKNSDGVYYIEIDSSIKLGWI
ncbi:hypothetical protein ABLO26_25505 [Neobacillus sp. 179-J 1A1 HS]|uniref:hypothetical protein n=1 Tax=Neobacillus driksii TaxID=3035913 RepID=UPI0035BBF324